MEGLIMKNFYLFLLALLLTGTACRENELPTEAEENSQEEELSFIYTKWRLVGMVDTQTGELVEFEPKLLEECYTITFISNTLAEGYAFGQDIALDLSMLGKYNLEDIIVDDLEDIISNTSNRFTPYIDNDKFLRALYSPGTQSYAVTLNELNELDELKFMNEIEHYYLLFKRIKNPYDDIVGKWKLIEIWDYTNYNLENTEIIDFSGNDIIFDFQRNNKLVVMGNVPDDLFFFDDVQKGEHYYIYNEPIYGPLSVMGPNLIIGMESWLGKGRYYGDIDGINKTLEMGGNRVKWTEYDENGFGIKGVRYRWSKKFIKLN